VLRQIQVLGAVDDEDAAPRVLVTAPGSALLTLYFKPSAVALSGQASLYNLAGELVARLPVTASTGKVEFDSSRYAGGIYLAVFDYVTPSGSKRQVVLKAAVLR